MSLSFFQLLLFFDIIIVFSFNFSFFLMFFSFFYIIKLNQFNSHCSSGLFICSVLFIFLSFFFFFFFCYRCFCFLLFFLFSALPPFFFFFFAISPTLQLFLFFGDITRRIGKNFNNKKKTKKNGIKSFKIIAGVKKERKLTFFGQFFFAFLFFFLFFIALIVNF